MTLESPSGAPQQPTLITIGDIAVTRSTSSPRRVGSRSGGSTGPSPTQSRTTSQVPTWAIVPSYRVLPCSACCCN